MSEIPVHFRPRRLADWINPTDPAAAELLARLGQAGLSPEQAYGYANRLVDQQAFTMAALDLFYASAIMLLLLIPLVWLARPSRHVEDAASGAH